MTRFVGVLAFELLSQVMGAQGITTAAIQGTVFAQDGSPIKGGQRPSYQYIWGNTGGCFRLFCSNNDSLEGSP